MVAGSSRPATVAYTPPAMVTGTPIARADCVWFAWRLRARAGRTIRTTNTSASRSRGNSSTTGGPLYRATCTRSVRPGSGPLGYSAVARGTGLHRHGSRSRGPDRPGEGPTCAPAPISLGVEERFRRRPRVTRGGCDTSEGDTAARHRVAEVPPRRLGGHPPAGGARQQPGPHEEGLADLLDGVRLLPHRHGEG